METGVNVERGAGGGREVKEEEDGGRWRDGYSGCLCLSGSGLKQKKKKVTVNPLAVCVQRCILGRMCDAQL